MSVNAAACAHNGRGASLESCSVKAANGICTKASPLTGWMQKELDRVDVDDMERAATQGATQKV
jgi:hypothetical protein